MSIQIKFASEARLEVAEAYKWYEEQKEGLGELFIAHTESAIGRILKSSKAYPTIENHQQYVLKKFPFVILYEKTKDTLYIDAVFHTSRNPEKKIR